MKKKKNQLVVDKQVVRPLVTPEHLAQVEGGQMRPSPPGGQTSPNSGC